MPKSKVQGVIFGILMSITMAYGMEVYNVAWKLGIPTMARGFSNMTNDVFADAFIEASYMWIFVFLFSNLWGTRGGASLAKRLIDPSATVPLSREPFVLAAPSLSCAHDEPCCKHP